MVHTAWILRPRSVELLGNSLGGLFFRVSKRYRSVAIKNLTDVYGGQVSSQKIHETALKVFQHFARAAFEFFYLLALSREQIDDMVELDGREHLDEALSHGKGCIILTAHYGNWELLARKLVIQGYTVSVIARDSDDPGITGITQRIRENGGYKVFDRDQPIIGAFRALKRNEILGILPDQNECEGIFVDYFGRPAKTAVGPAVLSLRSGAAIVPVFAPRIGRNKYKATAYPKIEFTPSGDEQKDIHDLTALVTNAIEREVRSNPSQWLWLHNRWKLSAEAPKDES